MTVIIKGYDRFLEIYNWLIQNIDQGYFYFGYRSGEQYNLTIIGEDNYNRYSKQFPVI